MTTEIIGTDDTHTGSSFESFLEEQGIRAEVDVAAISAVNAWQVAGLECAETKRQRRASSQPRPKA